MEVLLLGLERGVAQVAPQDGGHAQLMGVVEGLGDLLNLARGLVAAEVNGGPDCDGAHVPRLLHGGEHHLVVFVGVGQQLVVVQLQDERDLVRVAPRDRPQDAQRAGDGAASRLHGELDDVLGVEVDRVRGK